MIAFITKPQILGILILSVLFIVNIVYYKSLKNKNIFRLINAVLRVVLLIVFLFYFMHWPLQNIFQSILIYGAIIILLVDSFMAIRDKRKLTRAFILDNVLNFLLLVYFIRNFI